MKNSRIAGWVLGNLVDLAKVAHFAENTHRISAGLRGENAKNFLHQRHTKCTKRQAILFSSNDTAYVCPIRFALETRTLENGYFTAEFVNQTHCNVLRADN